MTIHALHAGEGYRYLMDQVVTGDDRLLPGQEMVDYYTVQGCPPGMWGGRGAQALGISGEVREDQMRALFGEGLHPEADRLVAEWIEEHGQSPLTKEVARQILIARADLGRGLTKGELREVRDDAINVVFEQEYGHPPSPADGGKELRRFLARQRGYDARSAARIADDAIASVRLGRRFATFKNDVPLLTKTRSALREQRLLKQGSLTEEEREHVRQTVAVAEFTREVGRAPADGAEGEAELRRYVAGQKAKVRQPVSGFDQVFTPVKSISILWGLGDNTTRRAIEDAHNEAVAEAMSWYENNLAFTRAGAGGVAQLDTQGITYSKHDHRDNRDGDPNLHSHVSVVNRVQGPDGKWRTLDSRTLHAARVAVSERYDLRVAQLIRNKLPGVQFEPVIKRPGGPPIYEVVGIDKALREEFSRRPQIEARLHELAAEYEQTHGRAPSKTVQYQLAQQATLDTRCDKGAPRSLEEMRTQWAQQAAHFLGSEHDTKRVIDAALGHPDQAPDAAPEASLDTENGVQPSAHPATDQTAEQTQTGEEGAEEQTPQRAPAARGKITCDPATTDPHTLAAKAIEGLSGRRSVWNRWHVQSQVTRLLAGEVFPTDVTAEQMEQFTERVTEAAMGEQLSVLLTPVENEVPDSLRRDSGASVFTVEGAQMFTSAAVLRIENTLIDATKTPVAYMATDADLEAALALTLEREGFTPSAEQQALARHFTHTGTLLAVGVGPAGTGKTTSMKLAAQAWQLAGGRVIALSHQGSAADILAAEITTTATPIHGMTLARMLIQNGATIRAGDMLLVDEAGMASRDDIAAITELARHKRAVVRLLGDPQQIAAIEAGGTLGLLAAETNAPTLREVRRFSNPEEGDVSLRWRDGDTSVISWYHANDRIRTGRLDQLPELMFAEWKMVEADGLIGQMIAPTNQQVTELNARVIAERRTAEHAAAQLTSQTPGSVGGGVGGTVVGGVPRTQRERLRRLFTARYRDSSSTQTPTGPPLPPREITLRDGLTVREGDRIATRKNRYDLRLTGSRGPVRNGHLYQLARIHADGSATVIRLDRKTRQAHSQEEKTTLPADYLTTFCEVGYAATKNGEQGDTVDAALSLMSPTMTRQDGYVAVTRGRETNLLFVPDDILPDPTSEHRTPGSGIAVDPADAILKDIINRDGAPLSAHEQAGIERINLRALDHTIPAYEYVADRLDRQALRATLAAAIAGPNPITEQLAQAREQAAAITDEAAWSSLQPKLDRAQTMAGGDPAARHQLLTRLITEAPDTTEEQRAADTRAAAWLLLHVNPIDTPDGAVSKDAPAAPATLQEAVRTLALRTAITAAAPDPRGSLTGAESPAKVLHHRLSLLQAADRKKAAAWLDAHRELLTDQLPELAYTATQAVSVLRHGTKPLTAHQQDALDTITVLSRQHIPGYAMQQLAQRTEAPDRLTAEAPDHTPQLDQEQEVAREQQLEPDAAQPELDLDLPQTTEHEQTPDAVDGQAIEDAATDGETVDGGALPPAPFTTDADYLAVACNNAEQSRIDSDIRRGLRDPNLPLAVPADPRHVAWDGAEPDLVTYARGPLRDKLIQRPAELGHHIARLGADARPAWTEPLGPPPKPGTDARTEYEAVVGQIAAYREQHNIRTPDNPLGDKPARAGARGTWQHLTDTANKYTAAAERRRQEEAAERAAKKAAAALQVKQQETPQQLQQRMQPPGPTISRTPRPGI